MEKQTAALLASIEIRYWLLESFQAKIVGHETEIKKAGFYQSWMNRRTHLLSVVIVKTAQVYSNSENGGSISACDNTNCILQLSIQCMIESFDFTAIP